MNNKFRVFLTAAVSAGLVVTSAASVFASDSSSEVQSEGTMDSGSLPLPGDLSSDASGVIENIIGEAGEASEDTIRIEFGEALQQMLAQSSGTDMSWLKSLSADGYVASDDSGTDVSASVSLNDSPLYDTQISYDAAEGTIYFVIPQLKDQPAAISLSDLSSALSDSGYSTSDYGSVNLSLEDLTKLQEDGKALGQSITADDISGFLGRYAGIVMQNMQTTQDGQTSVTAGSLSGTATMTTVSIQPEGMDQIFQSSASSLRDDELILKILGSDYAADLASAIASASSDSGSASDASSGTDSSTGSFDTGSSQQITGSEIVQIYQQFIDNYKDQLSGLPGVSVTYGNDENGKLCSVELKVLYSGVEVPIFTLSMINNGTQNAYEFTLGELLASALTSSASSGSTDSSADSSAASSGPTGFLLEGTTEGGKLNETFTVRASGQSVFTLLLSNWDTEKFKDGRLDGNLSVNVSGSDVRLAFESEQEGSGKCTLLVNESEIVSLSFEKKDADLSDVQKLDRTSAVELHSQDDLQNFFADASPDSLISALTAAGVPDEITSALSGSSSSASSSSSADAQQTDAAA